MSRDLSPNLNSLTKKWPKSVPLTTSYLKKQGYSYQLLHRYEKSGWIVSMGKGAYARAGDTVSWAGAVHTLQKELKLPIRLGGISVFNLAGYGHYLSYKDRVHLFGVSRKSLPRWFLPLMNKYDILLEPAGQLGDIPPNELSDFSFGDFSIAASPPELAYLEMLSQVPGRINFQEASEITAGLNTLRSVHIQKFLEISRSVKVNRLALYFGDFFTHPWRLKLLDDKIELGSGKRTIVPGGKLISRYQIVIPRDENVF